MPSMITVLADIFWFIVTFSILVVLHEGGHFLMARAFGVHVHEFMIGLPGPALRFHGRKTDYGITAVPLGGYVRISGMEPGPEDPLLGPALAYVTRRQHVTLDELAHDLGVDLADAESITTILVDWNAIGRSATDDDAFDAKHAAELADNPDTLLDLARSTTYRGLSRWKRIVVLSAGVVVNFISAVLVFVLVLSLVGTLQQTLTIDVVSPGSGAAAAGLKSGDTFTAVDGVKLKDWDALLTTLGKRKAGQQVAVTYERAGSTHTAIVKLGKGPEGRAILGIQIKAVNVPMPVGQALAMSFGLIGTVFKAISGFFVPATFQTSVSQSTGVIGIAVLAGQEAQRGPIDFAFFIALLSLSLGAMNVLPIPPLDGGKIAIEVIEAIAHRPLSRRLSIGLSLAGTLVLVALIGYLMYADVVRFVVNKG
ncbi:MAG: site-2 protease family protein [Coriobacteriia bacterium]|nr:site-2 protease family protein [Coriobacteriia bacterium]